MLTASPVPSRCGMNCCRAWLAGRWRCSAMNSCYCRWCGVSAFPRERIDRFFSSYSASSQWNVVPSCKLLCTVLCSRVDTLCRPVIVLSPKCYYRKGHHFTERFLDAAAACVKTSHAKPCKNISFDEASAANFAILNLQWSTP